MSAVEPERIRVLKDELPEGDYVLYWMQQSQRAESNPALEYAVDCADELRLPCVVAFGLMPDYPEAQERHFAFMLEGLAETQRTLDERGIGMVARKGEPWKVARDLAADAALVVCDAGYLRHQRQWRKSLRDALDKRIVCVEGDVVVPVEAASDKQESAARTLRPKIARLKDRFLKELAAGSPRKPARSPGLHGDIDLARGAGLLDGLGVPDEVPATKRFPGGTSEARQRLERFIRSDLEGYASRRSDPAEARVSELSPYLHFGQISPVEIALKVRRAKSGSEEDKAAYLEELIVRRELAVNFAWYATDYDRYSGLPDWARKTLDLHRDDERPARYTRKQLENADTHDEYWNAAMREGLHTGYMHNYMRMYWGKKIIEWCNTPEYAYETALYLNNRYFLDGRDPSSYANVGWLFGLHDRGWPERKVFGKVRYMNAAGLERKFDIDTYVSRVDSLVRAACAD